MSLYSLSHTQTHTHTHIGFCLSFSPITQRLRDEDHGNDASSHSSSVIFIIWFLTSCKKATRPANAIYVYLQQSVARMLHNAFPPTYNIHSFYPS